MIHSSHHSVKHIIANFEKFTYKKEVPQDAKLKAAQNNLL